MNLEKTTGPLINQTFLEKCCSELDLRNKEFIELKKIESEKHLQEKLKQRKYKDEYMVFNYFWDRFPHVMGTRDLNSQSLRQEINDSEFKRILKVAKRYYGFWAAVSSMIFSVSCIGFIWNLCLKSDFQTFIFSLFVICSTVPLHDKVSSYCFPQKYGDWMRVSARQRRIRSLYANTQKKEEINE